MRNVKSGLTYGVILIMILGYSSLCMAQNVNPYGNFSVGDVGIGRSIALVNNNQNLRDSLSLSEQDKLRQIIKDKNALNDSTPKTGDKQTGAQNFISEYWVQFLALIVSLIGVFFAVTGFTFANQKKKKSVASFLNQIDDTFASFKWKSKRCEAELYRIEDLVEDQLKNGKIDESSYELLTKRIRKYLKEVQEIDNPIHEKHNKRQEQKRGKFSEGN